MCAQVPSKLIKPTNIYVANGNLCRVSKGINFGDNPTFDVAI